MTKKTAKKRSKLKTERQLAREIVKSLFDGASYADPSRIDKVEQMLKDWIDDRYLRVADRLEDVKNKLEGVIGTMNEVEYKELDDVVARLR